MHKRQGSKAVGRLPHPLPFSPSREKEGTKAKQTPELWGSTGKWYKRKREREREKQKR
jgi:hypothetical protein